VVETHLRRRSPDRHQIAGPIDVPGEHANHGRSLGAPACGNRGGRRRATVHAAPELQERHAAHELEIDLEFSVDSRLAAALGPCLVSPEQVRRRGGKLGVVFVFQPRPVRRVHRARRKAAQVVASGDRHVAHVAEKLAFIADQVLVPADRHHHAFVVEVVEVIHVVLRAPFGQPPKKFLPNIALQTSQ